ncbi:hypothetical protein GCM10011512_03220 [Tersicoccus solisilvae]|uniref:Cardiolipin synthase N-terminal domain-containing protein n=1 Tax=Tersicoccus solisilvae TaxID=1882339 RepID=A0ABQ1NPN2_9MICC|nr:PLDc N-terminal domain-containing protein [Tersicoccus solisilvae]GGC79930.1 hypothetical protein GCM10011512_03220 [Tersicoccus solisilvae]
MSTGTPSATTVLSAEEPGNALAPMAWEVLVGGIGLSLLLYMVVGLVSVLSSRVVTGPVKVTWAVVVLAFPLLGPTAWFVWRARQSTSVH